MSLDMRFQGWEVTQPLLEYYWLALKFSQYKGRLHLILGVL